MGFSGNHRKHHDILLMACTVGLGYLIYLVAGLGSIEGSSSPTSATVQIAMRSIFNIFITMTV